MSAAADEWIPPVPPWQVAIDWTLEDGRLCVFHDVNALTDLEGILARARRDPVLEAATLAEITIRPAPEGPGE